MGDESVIKRVRELILALEQKGYEEGLDPKSGGLFYDLKNGKYQRKKIWWVQSEAMVGFECFRVDGAGIFLDAAYGIWKFFYFKLLR
ncbi:MAG TPA: hypothetical protein VHY08_08190 [Bacillota bacterium]|nr:hypothetical protein [Bacillota bacterium]